MADYDWWRASLAGENPPVHESPAECGYFKVRDNVSKYKSYRETPFLAAAIWRDEAGELHAEIGGEAVRVDWGVPGSGPCAWPYVAKRVITFEQYEYWHRHGHWPEEPKDDASNPRE